MLSEKPGRHSAARLKCARGLYVEELALDLDQGISNNHSDGRWALGIKPLKFFAYVGTARASLTEGGRAVTPLFAAMPHSVSRSREAQGAVDGQIPLAESTAPIFFKQLVLEARPAEQQCPQ